MNKNNIYVIVIMLSLWLSSCNNNDIISRINTSDSIKIDSIIQIFSSSYLSHKDSVDFYSSQTENKINNFVDISNYPYIYNSIGLVHYYQSQYGLAEKYFIKAKDAFLLKNDSISAAKQTANIGTMYDVMGDYTGAIDYYLSALEIFKSVDDKIAISLIYNNIGVLYQNLNQPQKAIVYYTKSHKIRTENNFNITGSTLVNIGTVYEELLNDNDSAMYYYKQAENIIEQNKDSIHLGIVKTNIGNIYTLKNNFDSAGYYLNTAKKIYDRHYNADGINSTNKYICTLELEKENINEAIIILNEAIKYSTKTNDIRNNIDLLLLLSNAHSKNKNYKTANYYLKKHQFLKDSLLGIENQENINQLEVRYSLKEKNNTIKILELETNLKDGRIIRLGSVIFLMTIIFIVLFIIFRLYRQNSKLEIKQMRIDIADYISQIEEIKEKNTEGSKAENKDALVINKFKDFDLSKKEEEVLLLISKGYKNAEIAEKMFITINTVKTHTKSIFIKLDVRNRIEAVNKTQI